VYWLAMMYADQLSHWWYEHFPHEKDDATVRSWLSLGVSIQAAARLQHIQLSRLGYSHSEAPGMLLAAGGQPDPDSVLEKSMLEAVLTGACSELGPQASPTLPMSGAPLRHSGS
jgi:hypothetical protein